MSGKVSSEEDIRKRIAWFINKELERRGMKTSEGKVPANVMNTLRPHIGDWWRQRATTGARLSSLYATIRKALDAAFGHATRRSR